MTARVADILLPADTHANRPAAADVPVGAVFPCTTDGTLDRNNGTTWDTWATLVGAGIDLADLGDVDLTGVADGNSLTYDSGSSLWVPGAGGGGTSTPAGQPPLAGSDDYDFTATSTSLPAGWSWEQQGTGTWQERYGAGCIVLPSASFNYVRGIYRALPASFSKCTLKFAATSGTGNEGPGMLLRNSVSGKIAHFQVRATSHVQLTYFSAANGTVGTDNDLSAIPPGPLHGGSVMQIVKNSSTSWDFKWGPSYDALGTFYAAQDVTAATQGFTPDQIGFGYLCIGGGPKAAALDWIKFE